MQKLKQNDEVVVITGKDKGKRGTVTRLLPYGRVLVSGINLVKRHTRANPNMNQPGGIIEKEASIHVSNVAIFNPQTNKADRVGIQVQEDGARKRVFKSSNTAID